MNQTKAKIYSPDKERIKCGKCGHKMFDMNLVKDKHVIEVSCHSCKDIFLLLPLPEEEKNDKNKITKPIQPKIAC